MGKTIGLKCLKYGMHLNSKLVWCEKRKCISITMTNTRPIPKYWWHRIVSNVSVPNEIGTTTNFVSVYGTWNTNEDPPHDLYDMHKRFNIVGDGCNRHAMSLLYHCKLQTCFDCNINAILYSFILHEQFDFVIFNMNHTTMFIWR